MRALVQRVARASVDVDGARIATIGAGLCAFVGVTHDDGPAEATALARKVWHLRILDDADGVMNESTSDRHASGSPAQVLVVSQFTLYADTTRGRRPSWSAAARPEHAEPLVRAVIDELRSLGADVAAGRFRAEMAVALVNDGPVTLLVEV